MIGFVEYLNIPIKMALIIVGIFFVIQIIGELLEFKGKVVPEIVKVRKYFARKRREKREWVDWVNNRAQVYDSSINKLGETLTQVVQALKDNTRMTEEMFVQNSRDRIIDFASKVGDEKVMVSKEEFNRIFKVHKRYEDFLAERGLSNGEVDIAYRIIEESYAAHMKNHTFIENIRGYDE